MDRKEALQVCGIMEMEMERLGTGLGDAFDAGTDENDFDAGGFKSMTILGNLRKEASTHSTLF